MTGVRALEAADEPAWRDLFRAYGEFYRTTFADDVLDRVWAQLLRADSGIDALVATDAADEPIGIAHYRSHPDTFTGNRDWFLDDLFVTPDARGTGAGAALVTAIRDLAAPGDGVLRWITAADNERAQRLYDRIAKRTTWVTYEVRL